MAQSGDVYGGFTIIGESLGDNFATSVADVGDMNGDGIDDVIIGARFHNIPSFYFGNAYGAGYVIFGSLGLSGQTILAGSLDGMIGFKIEGGVYGGQMGFSSSYAGDINDDGFDDAIIGAQDANSAYLIYGSGEAFPSAINVGTDLDGTNGTRLLGYGGLAGSWVSDAGDFNNDGIDDVVVNARYANSSYVVFGQSGGLGTQFALSSLDGTNGFRIVGGNGGDQAGLNIENLGDVNNDGIDDLGIRTVASQQVSVLYGSTVSFPATFNLGAIDGINGFNIPLPSNGHLAGLGDINGDGIDDFAVGSGIASPFGRYRAGETYVVFGQDGNFSSSFDLADLDGSNGFTIAGAQANDQLSVSVTTAGDVNGDGLDDILVGAYRATRDGQVDRGEAYLIFGKSTGFAASYDLAAFDPAWGYVFQSDGTSDYLGLSLSDAGDLNGDGFGDIILGARGAYPSGRGRAFVVYGGEDRLSALDAVDGAEDGFIQLANLGVELALPPIAEDDSLGTDEDTVLSANVLDDNGNGTDADPNGGPLTVTAVDGAVANVGAARVLASGALLTVNSDGSFDYDPRGAFDHLADGDTANETFSYEITDDTGKTDTAIVTIAVDGVNDAPVAVDDSFSATEDFHYIYGNMKANDYDVDGSFSFDWRAFDIGSIRSQFSSQGVTVTSATYTSSGGITVAYDKASVQHLGLGETISASTNYTVRDTSGATDLGQVTLTISGLNDAPVAVDDATSVLEDGVTLNLWNALLSNDSDVESDPLSIVSIDVAGTLGTVILDATNQSMVFRADDDAFDALDSGQTLVTMFDYVLSDGLGAYDVATVSVTVIGVPEPRPGGTTAGTDGDDFLQGSDADDRLNGGGGDDILNGGLGDDDLNGGSGIDTFLFYPDCDRDTITGFEPGMDKIDARGVLGLASQAEVFAYFDTNGDNRIDDADAHSYRSRGELVLEFDGDMIDGNADDAMALKGILYLTAGEFGDAPF